jgi:hypothetical protein
MLISADALNRSVPRCILLGKLSTAEVLRLRAQALCQAKNWLGAALRMTILWEN